jgi:hypothetical protein
MRFKVIAAPKGAAGLYPVLPDWQIGNDLEDRAAAHLERAWHEINNPGTDKIYRVLELCDYCDKEALLCYLTGCEELPEERNCDCQ